MTKLQIYIFSLLYFTIQFGYTQGFDKSVLKVIENISKNLDGYNQNFQLAIYPFKYNKDNEAVLAEYVTEEFWDIMPKIANNYDVMNRATFDEYYQEHRLKSSGLIDPKTEKKFGMLIAADAYVSGKIYVFNSLIRLKVTVTNTETGRIITTGSSKLPITYDIAAYIGLKDWKEKIIEAEKNKSTNPNCQKKEVGDMCFQNNSKKKYLIKIQNLRGVFSTIHRQISVEPGKYGCFKDLPSEVFYYSIIVDTKTFINITKGNFFINICQSSIIDVD